MNPTTSAPGVATSAEPVDLTTPGETLPDISGLRLSFRQVASERDVKIELALKNAGPGSVRITTNPRFDHRTFDGSRMAEFAFQIIDARGRWIANGCIENKSPFEPHVEPLPAGQTRTFALSLDRHCYDLVPGEQLSFIATYANLFSQMFFRERTKSLPDVQPSDWIELVVPRAWSNAD